MRVLVIDDDESISEFLGWVLDDEGHDVTQASNGSVALAILESCRPDLILLDMRMPVMDGWQFSKAYRESKYPKAPIVVMTAAQDAASRAGEIEADAYLGKPFDVDELLRTIHRFDGRG